MRNFLVTKVLCANCKQPIELEYSDKHGPYCKDEPTGAAMVELSLLAHPCECTLADSRALATLKGILK